MRSHNPNKSAFVLVVEGDIYLRKSIEQILTAKGHFVMAATNIADARELMNEKDFDLLVANVNLLDGSGMQLLRKAQKPRKTKAIIINPAEKLLDPAPGTLMGPNTHYLEPFTLNDFEKKISDVIE